MARTKRAPNQVQVGDEDNLSTIIAAAKNDDLCVMRTTRRNNGKPVTLLCAATRDEDGAVVLVPMAEMFDGNPYVMYDPPGGTTPLNTDAN